MIKQTTHSLTHIVFLLLIFSFFNGCQETLVEPNQSANNNETLLKDPGTRIPDTYVHGIVYNGSVPTSGVYMKLLDADNNNALLAQTTTNSSGYYSICVCCYGYGNRVIEATYFDKPNSQVLTDSETFTFAQGGPYDYEIDLQLQENK